MEKNFYDLIKYFEAEIKKSHPGLSPIELRVQAIHLAKVSLFIDRFIK